MWRSTHLKLQHGSLRNLNGGKGSIVLRSKSRSVFLNGFMHMLEYSMIVIVDMEGNTWRTIHKPSGAKMSIHQA